GDEEAHVTLRLAGARAERREHSKRKYSQTQTAHSTPPLFEKSQRVSRSPRGGGNPSTPDAGATGGGPHPLPASEHSLISTNITAAGCLAEYWPWADRYRTARPGVL